MCLPIFITGSKTSYRLYLIAQVWRTGFTSVLCAQAMA